MFRCALRNYYDYKNENKAPDYFIAPLFTQLITQINISEQ